jgi:DNA invertase Pin-like site-specific DNA recombinase
LNVVGYTRVSTQEQGDSGLGLEAQRAAIVLYCTQRGWTLDTVYQDVASGAKLAGRPELDQALNHQADAIIVAKLDRLSRSLLDFASLLERSRTEGWALVALDLGVDTSTAAGEMMANVVASFAQYERRRISERTVDALKAARERGVKLGAPRTIPAEVEADIIARVARGVPYREIRGSTGYSLGTISRILNRDTA